MNFCTGTNRDGAPCTMRPVQDGLCFIHFQMSRQVEFYQVPTAEIFTWPTGDIEYRIRCLSVKEIQSLECVCNGQTYEAAAAILGVTVPSFSNRMSTARARAGMKTVQQLIAMYAAWRMQRGGMRMP